MRSESGKQLVQAEGKAADVVERYRAELLNTTQPIVTSRSYPPNWLNAEWQERFAAEVLREIRAEPHLRLLRITNRMLAILGPQATYWGHDYAASKILPSGNEQRMDWIAANSDIFATDAKSSYLVKSLRESVQQPGMTTDDPTQALNKLDAALKELADFLRRR